MCRATFHDDIDVSRSFSSEQEDDEHAGALPDEAEVRIVRERMNELLQSVQSIQRGIESLRSEALGASGRINRVSDSDQQLADVLDSVDRQSMRDLRQADREARRARRESRQRSSLSALLDQFDQPERALDASELEMAMIQQQIAEIDRATAEREAREAEAARQASDSAAGQDSYILNPDHQNQQENVNQNENNV